MGSQRSHSYTVMQENFFSQKLIFVVDSSIHATTVTHTKQLLYMDIKTKKPLTNPYPLRLDKDTKKAIREIARVNDITEPQAIRLCMRVGLPIVKKKLEALAA